MNELPHRIEIVLPEWTNHLTGTQRTFTSDHDKMAFVIELSRQNIVHATGGPFGAALFRKSNSTLLSVGVNMVVSSNNSVLHAEVVAIMLAEKKLRSFSLDDDVELFASCEPCAMCLGASLWSGVKRIVCAASGKDARAIGFDEGPVFPQSWEYLQNRGVEIVHDFQRAEANKVLKDYTRLGGNIYNAT